MNRQRGWEAQVWVATAVAVGIAVYAANLAAVQHSLHRLVTADLVANYALLDDGFPTGGAAWVIARVVAALIVAAVVYQGVEMLREQGQASRFTSRFPLMASVAGALCAVAFTVVQVSAGSLPTRCGCVVLRDLGTASAVNMMAVCVAVTAIVALWMLRAQTRALASATPSAT
ncbi:hypothetical protein [Catellatospora methionotrophica]|uniref:hypothetical protein n=1 Tax=Catellatospora methionotrophica TaxID=121620 RepID=UPI00340B6A77